MLFALPAMFIPFLKTKRRPLRATDAIGEIGNVVQRTPLSCSPALRWTGICFYSGIAVDPLPGVIARPVPDRFMGKDRIYPAWSASLQCTMHANEAH
jgi:hypothetical protein